jgi:hypothetical protein
MVRWMETVKKGFERGKVSKEELHVVGRSYLIKTTQPLSAVEQR